MKKFTALALALVLSLSLSSCGNNGTSSDDNSGSNSGDSAGKKQTINLVIGAGHTVGSMELLSCKWMSLMRKKDGFIHHSRCEYRPYRRLADVFRHIGTSLYHRFRDWQSLNGPP